MEGFRFVLEWNDSYAFREYPQLTAYQQVHQKLIPDMSGKQRGSAARCVKCGELLNKWTESLNGLVIEQRGLDISTTYDGIVVVSCAFMRAYEQANLQGLAFRTLPQDGDFYAVRPSKEVCFDAERRKVQFTKKCDLCGHYQSIIGSSPIFLQPGALIENREIVRTDLEFGTGDGKHPVMLCTAESASLLRGLGLKGIILEEFVAETHRKAMERRQQTS